jgi:hypothetical protein
VYAFNPTVPNIYESRKKHKAEHNPLEAVEKSLLNSAYGKTIQNPISTSWEFFKDDSDKYIDYWVHHQNEIQSDTILGKATHMLKVLKPIDKHFNLSIVGILILAMSKRIMNEVMCLAEDIGCQIYYQDTDSMHISVDDLEMLESEFRNVYHRELVGKDLGNFHSDFPEICGETPVAAESIFVGKKIYIDKLMNSKNKIGFHVRCKGVSQDAIIGAASRELLDIFSLDDEDDNLIKEYPGFDWCILINAHRIFIDMLYEAASLNGIDTNLERVSLDIS